MTTTIQKLGITRTFYATLAASFLFAVVPSMANADGWELRTARATVPGTAEIESGKIEKAIQISGIQLPHASQQQKVAVLTNLCIAYILSSDFVKADSYCDQAVERPNERSVSYNNRGVLKALQGDLEAAMQDFQSAAIAGCLGDCNEAKNVPRDLPRPVARRNFGKAEYLAKAAKTGSDEQLASRND